MDGRYVLDREFPIHVIKIDWSRFSVYADAPFTLQLGSLVRQLRGGFTYTFPNCGSIILRKCADVATTTVLVREKR